MHRLLACFAVLAFIGQAAWAQVSQRVVDIPTRPGVTQSFLYLAPQKPSAAVILFAGGHGGVQMFPNGQLKYGDRHFLLRTRQQLADRGLSVAIVDAPSDRQTGAFLNGFRQTPEHVADIKAVIAWLKQQSDVPVWLAGFSRGTQSAAFISTQARPPDGGPDGLILASTILAGDAGRPVTRMPLQNLAIPVLVIHHEQDGCKLCPFSEVPGLMEKLSGAPRKELLSFRGGSDRGDPCEAMAYHGFNGMDEEAMDKIAAWVGKK
jgi:dienelactone hydrolase